jgi:hypothetical protein
MEAVWSSGSHILGKDTIKCGNQHIFNDFRRRPPAAYILTRAQSESPDPVIYIPSNFAPNTRLRAKGPKEGEKSETQVRMEMQARM